MYHGIKYKGLRYKLFSIRWKRKNRNWKDCAKKTQGNEKGLGKEVSKMIDCSKTANYLSEKLRMTKKTKTGLCKTKCSDCPLCNDNNGKGLSCATFEMYYPEKAISAIQRWSDEHPPKTYLSESHLFQAVKEKK